MLGTSPDGVHLWLKAKPLDAAIGQVPAPHCSSGHHGQRIRCKAHKTNKTQLLASDYRTFLLENQVTLGTQNGPSTQLIDATSCAKM